MLPELADYIVAALKMVNTVLGVWVHLYDVEQLTWQGKELVDNAAISAVVLADAIAQVLMNTPIR